METLVVAGHEHLLLSSGPAFLHHFHPRTRIIRFRDLSLWFRCPASLELPVFSSALVAYPPSITTWTLHLTLFNRFAFVDHP